MKYITTRRRSSVFLRASLMVFITEMTARGHIGSIE